MKEEKDEVLKVANKTKNKYAMQINGKFITLDTAFALGWINKRSGEVTKKYLNEKALKEKRKKKAEDRKAKAKAKKAEDLIKKKNRLALRKKREAEAKAEKASKLKAKKERQAEKARQEKIAERERAKRKKEGEKQRSAKAKAKAEAKEKAQAEREKKRQEKIKKAEELSKERSEKLKRFQEEALRVGLPTPQRLPRKQRVAGEIIAEDGTVIKCPYDMDRRSGYKVIWQVLAEKHDQVVSNEELHKEVNKRLAEDPESAEWYREKYSSILDDLGMPSEYPVVKNAADVMTRHPYNGVKKTASGEYIVNPISIEGLGQRIVAGANGVMLKTKVETSYADLCLQKASK